jgi:hypothetical protein
MGNDVATATLPAILGDLDGLLDHKIRSFLAGNNDGGVVLEALYGDIIDEPLPARLTALLGSNHDGSSAATGRPTPLEIVTVRN